MQNASRNGHEIYSSGHQLATTQNRDFMSLTFSQIGVKEIRELFGVMIHQEAPKGIFMTTSVFSDDAVAFAKKQRSNLRQLQ